MTFSISRRILFAATILFLGSCHKDEPLYPAPNIAKGLQTQTFEMGESYSQQLYFDFESQQTGSNAFGLWDIGVSCSGDPHVIICGGKNVQFAAAKIENTDFLSLKNIDPKNLNWKYDHPEGHPDSLALSGCFKASPDGYVGNENEVYVFDLGADSSLSTRYIKMQFLTVTGGVYQFAWGYLNDTAGYYLTKIQTKPEYNYAYYSFGKRALVQNEIFHNKNWDLVFTTYKEPVPDVDGTIFHYIIRGALINPLKISVAQIDGTSDFNSFSYADALQVPLHKKLNEIGYDWKTFDMNSGKYTIVPTRFYVLKTKSGNYFKMRFVDFYDDQGRKGFPKMAWELLKP